MLFSYRRITHQMEKMHEFIDYIFYEVWCKAPTTQYGIHLFEQNPDLHEIMEDLFRQDSAGCLKDGSAAKFFYEATNVIYNHFKSLKTHEINEYKKYYGANNNIELCCCGDSSCEPVTYSSLNKTNESLNKALEHFFLNLYSSGFLALKNTTSKIGSLDDYYDCFVRHNDEGVCPFCGLSTVDGEFSKTREAFDHYLPKSKYPFNSVNLANLAPSCHKCNSGNKLNKDPLHDSAGHRRKAFYPFSTMATNTTVTVSILNKQWVNLTPGDFEIDFGPVALNEEISTWKDLYGIEARY